MKKVTVWFNHWFSTAYHIINLMKDDEKLDVYVIGSSRNPDSVIQLVCDEWYTEPTEMNDSDYLEFCLDFCLKHDINVFAPHRGMDIIGKFADKFDNIGVKLLLDTDYNVTGILKDKISTYKYLSDITRECIPTYYEVGNSEAFKAAYEKIIAGYENACFKFTDDEGATSFRLIDNSVPKNMRRASGLKISYDFALKLLSSYDFHHHFIVMPYLRDVEVSVDCLNTAQGNIIIPRYKSNGRIYTIKYDKEIMSYAERILEYTGLRMPCNIQFKYNNGKPYLLEINTRMSGGVQLSCVGAGVNIPNLALNKLLGINKEWSMDYEPKKVSYIESPVKL